VTTVKKKVPPGANGRRYSGIPTAYQIPRTPVGRASARHGRGRRADARPTLYNQGGSGPAIRAGDGLKPVLRNSKRKMQGVLQHASPRRGVPIARPTWLTPVLRDSKRKMQRVLQHASPKKRRAKSTPYVASSSRELNLAQSPFLPRVSSSTSTLSVRRPNRLSGGN
jgi:hypothetical protein